MKIPLTRLTEKTANLGNYNRKYLHIISSNIEKLTAALEQQGKLDRVHLWSYSMEIPGEMDTVREAASSHEEALDFLGCYYAMQFLQMNLRMVDVVKLELATSLEPGRTGKKLMLEAGRMFRYLTKSYMERLLDIFLDKENTPEFVMLGVGTRSDQDDIDLGIVHRGPRNPEILNHAIARLSSQMFKTATQLHFHLSEHVGGGGSLSATIDEYEELLDNDDYDFVMVTEMLGAAAILGSHQLFEQFRAKVTDRFFFDRRVKANRFHEGYLRGILGEIHSLLTRPKPSDTINPKEDALRPIKGLLSALKLVYGIRKVNAWNIIDELKEKNPERLAQYDDLEKPLSFFEMFRYLYQIMVAQDEDICLYEPSIEAMVGRIAEMIGLEKKGVVSAKDFMLVLYYEFLEKGIKAIDILTDDLKRHLRKVSIYTPIFTGEIHRKPGYRGNLAVDFIKASTFSGGITYWDDFLEVLGGADDSFYDEFVESFHELSEKMRGKVAAGYVSGTKYDVSSILRFLVILGKKAREETGKAVFDLIGGLFIEELGRLPSASASLTHISYANAEALNNFLALLNWEALGRLLALARRKPVLPELLQLHDQLLALINVHYQSSHFFKRHFYPILEKYPLFTKNLHSNDKLKEMANGFYGDLTALASLDERFERLGDYYDMEFVRVSLMAMAGGGCAQTDAEFIEFCDNYTQTLYEFCLQNVHLSLGYAMHFHDRFALYAAGGLAREQGFDDDYDMIVILDSDNAEEMDYCNKIVAKLNSHILKRGILPHHRFASHFDSYVVSLDKLVDLINSGKEDVFVDQSQILSSRMLVGSGKLEEELQRKIIGPCIFDREQDYIGCMMKEMGSRHEQELDDQRNNIKECKGGLRDIEMLLLICKARHKVRDPLTRKFLRRLVEIDPEHGEQYAYMEKHLNFLKNLRDLYRLKVAASDDIEREHLPPVAASIGYGDDDEAAGRLYNDFLERTDQAANVIVELMAGITT